MRLRRERYLLPVQATNLTRPYGKACHLQFGGRTLRDAADYICDCGESPSPQPDHPGSLLKYHTGTLGAKQALLAALAEECESDDLELIVACCEMQLPVQSGARRGTALKRPSTLPLAVCWLRVLGHRVQISGTGGQNRTPVNPITEVAVRPEDLPGERIRLYKAFAADWCRALEVSPMEFARLRSWQLRTAPNVRRFEDLMGYALPPGFAPEL